MDILPNVTMKIALTSEKPVNKDDWYCFSWEVTLTNNKKSYTFPYDTGIGLFDKKKPRFPSFDRFSLIEIDEARDGIKGTTIQKSQLDQMNKKYGHKWDYLLYKPKTPTKNEILQSLAIETVNMLEMPTFEEWCSDFGYNNDSIKAKKIFEYCYEVAAQMKKLLNAEDFQTFITTDYDNLDSTVSTDLITPSQT